jgi:hypothetical protein
MDSEIDDRDGTIMDPVFPALLSSVDVQKAFITLHHKPFERLDTFKAQTLKVHVNSQGISVKETKRSVLLAILKEYVSDYGICNSLSVSLSEIQRQKIRWFDANDKLINPPDKKELVEIVTAVTSEGGFTVMDLNTAMTLFETTDDLEVLHDLPQSLLVELYTQVLNLPTKGSLKSLSKCSLINKLGDVVRHCS